MSTVKYYITRNEGVKTTYARVHHNAYLSFKDICDETAKQLGIPNELIEAVGKSIMRNAYDKACDGYRVELGDLLSLYPQVHKSAVDKIDKQTGNVITPSDEEMVPTGKDGELRCEVHKKANRTFRENVNWEKIDDKNINDYPQYSPK